MALAYPATASMLTRLGAWGVANPTKARMIGEGIKWGGRYLGNKAVKYMRGRTSIRRQTARSGALAKRRGMSNVVSAGRGSAMAPGSTRMLFVRRRRMNTRGRYTRGRKKRFRAKKSRKMSDGKLLKYIKGLVCTPKVTKLTLARNYGTSGWGCRSWAVFLVNSKDNLLDMWSRRPSSGFFLPSVTNPAAAHTVTEYSQSHKCHLTSWVDKYILQNRSNSEMHLKVYECVVRRKKSFTLGGSDMYSWVIDRFNQSDSNVDDKDVLQPGYAGANDYLDTVWKNPTYTPYMSTHFCNDFRIIKTTSYKIAMNDYIMYSLRVNRLTFSGSDVDSQQNAGFQENIGGWTKILMCTWVGGPCDNEVLGGDPATSRQTKGKCDLFLQVDREYKFYFEPRGELLYNIASSNATAAMVGVESINTYSTRSDSTGVVVGASSIQQSNANDDVAQVEH